MQDYNYFCRCFHIIFTMSLEDIIKKLDADTKARMARKVPSWFSVIPGSDRESLIFPTALSTQQCSSEATALYKASVAVGKPLSRRKIADLTGGLGVDSWAFSKCFDKVLYNEANSGLAAAVKHNFEILGCNNIFVSNKLLKQGSLSEILGDFEPDIIFLDPARRSQDGKKVFLLEDCQPDVLILKDELLEACPNLLLKLSPMADITMLLQRLGNVRELHVVAFDGECKELLVLLQRGWNGPASLTLCEEGQTLHFPEYYDTISNQNPTGYRALRPVDIMGYGHSDPISGKTDIEPAQLLYEPGKALLKAGLFDYPCTLGYKKLAQHTHLYIAPSTDCHSDSFCHSDRSGGISLPGKYFRIEKVLPLQSRTIKELSRQGIAAEVSTHNIPIKAEDLKKRLHATPSPTAHIFAASTPAGNLLIITTRI